MSALRRKNGQPGIRLDTQARSPQVLRGACADWPAVRSWTFAGLAALAPTLRVELVVGNRELGRTQFASSMLGPYLNSLAIPGAGTQPLGHLKEFDLLAQFPQLRRDLLTTELFPPGTIVASSAWIGPVGARTGLHCDHLDNIAVLVAGRKRFHLAPPDVLRPQDDLSGKYDRWARLAGIPFQALAERADTKGALQTVDLQPGDALFIPSGWWHEVVNLESSILLSGFFGRPAFVIGQWLRTGIVHAAHLAGLWRRGDCSCHE